jgi:3-hydroxyacyl-CoA dehydrogenase
VSVSAKQAPPAGTAVALPVRVRRIGVIGAGTMGAGIAALAASAGLPVDLLDVPGDADRNGLARKGLERALAATPAAFMHRSRASLVDIGNTEDDLGRLRECDWVIEAIVEDAEVKQALFARLEDELVESAAIVSTNTSAIPIATLATGRSEWFRRRFLGTHFFNPPRYLHLLELIPGAETDPAVVELVRDAAEVLLGKGVVVARDVPGFIANRLGMHGIVTAIRLMEEHGLAIDEVDALTGELIGRPRSATFRTADLSGLDVVVAVAAGLERATGEDFALPRWVHDLVAGGRLGEKTKAGFYRREDGEILTLDWRSGDYRPRQRLDLPQLRALREQPLEERLQGAVHLPGPYGPFLRRLLVETLRYAVERAPEIADDLASVDRAVEWGFGWEHGPIRLVGGLGADFLRTALADEGFPAPPLLDDLEQGRAAPELSSELSARRARAAGGVLESGKDASLLDLGDGVLLLELHSRLNVIGEGALRTIARALERGGRERCAGLVIGNDDPRAFSAGANLALIAMLAQEGDWDELDAAVRHFQRATTSLRDAPFPVVAAPFGLTLGGGCEVILHADLVQAHAELYAGFVEVGVGLIPAGGGTKEILVRFARELAPYPEADPFEAVRRAFTLIGLARTSTSALEARELGFLRDCDRITMNRDRLIADAKARVLDFAPGYVAPQPPKLTVLGNEALGNLRYAAWILREAGRASEHDVRVAEELALVLCGGDGPPHEVTEEELLGLERQAFLRLLGTRKTRERIAHMLKTGKPLRN